MKTLKDYREAAGRTEKEMGQFLHIGTSHYQQIEAGKRRLNHTQILKLANLFGVSPEDLQKAETGV